MNRRAVLPLIMLLSACVPAGDIQQPSRAAVQEPALPPMKTFGLQPRPATAPHANTDLVRDFMQLTFQMESGRILSTFTRFDGPVTVRVTGDPPPTLRADLRDLIARLRNEADIPISLTTEVEANITVQAVSRRAIRQVLPQAACFVAPNVSSIREYRSARRAPKTNWSQLRKREKIAIFIPNDSSPQEVRDCLHEELAQALGPLNDLYRLPDSVFNDDNVHTVLTGFDMLMLRATYAPELKNGMSRQEVADRLPAVFRRLNRGGNRPGTGPASPTPQEWRDAVQTALGPGAGLRERQGAADQALRIAIRAGWTDNRRAFSHYARARLLQATDGAAAKQQYAEADRFYAMSPRTRLHRAYVATQLAAYALSEGNPSQAIDLVTPHLDAARASQNASLLATLELLRAEALLQEGRVTEARAVRLDSLGWARYGFGADWVVRAKLREIASLTGDNEPA
ncbi:DUF2927 domain-containing protein [uncultured Roseobacter sp.]|uniref:DUF2927 domain-containing protein n=1 Tax=uncultured Roseobacter sp. TaxID=114847 RepID=UPI00260F5E21|nr:DUF2927 domain-containing protein [uncultured Roseobacter sp.]